MNKKANKNNNPWNLKRILAAICAAVLAVLFLLSSLYPAFGAKASAVSEAKAARDSAKKTLDNIKNEKSDIVKEYANIDSQLTEVEDRVAELSLALESTKTEIADKEQELALAEENTAAYKESFKRRARIMYENGSTSYIEVLLGAADFGDFVEKAEIIADIVSYDREVLDKFVESQRIIKTAKEEKEALLLKQQNDKESLEYRQDELELTLEKKQALIDKLAEDESMAAKAFAAAEKKYEEEERKAQEEIRRQLASKQGQYTASKYTGGKFQWPVPSSSRITDSYGNRIHPIRKTANFHRGIDIGAAYGSDIVAAEAGTVVIAKYNSSYGRYVVINHGNGYTTLYAHNSQLLVSPGQTVSRGQVIAKAGSTGNSTGPHCHFEVSYNGSLQNPMNYLK